jgi:DUF4097 and DUF4098 domain-containing protein YvlB
LLIAGRPAAGCGGLPGDHPTGGSIMKTSGRYAVTLLIAAGLATCWATVVRAQETIDESRNVKADVRVEVENVSGTVTVTGWDREEIKITGTLGRGTERLDIEGTADRIRIEVVLPQHARNVDDTDLEIQMPVKGSLEVNTVSADIEAAGVDGEVYLQSVSGDIDLSSHPVEADIETVSGDIKLLVDSDQVRAKAVSGDIIVRKAHGTLSAETVSGDITVEGATFRRLDSQTVSGDIRLSGDLEKGGVYRFESHSGTIELLLPEALNADFEVSTYSGEIESDFGGRARRTSRYAPGQEMNFTAGDGGASVRIDTFSGDVELRAR